MFHNIVCSLVLGQVGHFVLGVRVPCAFGCAFKFGLHEEFFFKVVVVLVDCHFRGYDVVRRGACSCASGCASDLRLHHAFLFNAVMVLADCRVCGCNIVRCGI